MKVADLVSTGYFAQSVTHAVEQLAGDGAEIAAWLAQDDERRHAFIATPIGVLECILDTSKPMPDPSIAHPLESKLHRWEDWPRLTIEGNTYLSTDGGFSTTWRVGGLPAAVGIRHGTDRQRELAEFVRACVQQQEQRRLD